MTENEKKEILDELEQRFEKKYKGTLFREDTQTVLKEPREKWFRDSNGGGYYSMMAEAFDNSVVSWQVWELVRRLTCMICGKHYVRHIANNKQAADIAERLCQFIYDLRKEYKEIKEMEKSNGRSEQQNQQRRYQ